MTTNKKTLLKGDKYIWGIYLLLSLISIIAIYSSSSTLTYAAQSYTAPVMRHTLFLAVGGGLVWAIHYIHYRWFKLAPFLLWPLALILLVVVLFQGESVNGAQRWVMGIQPSEVGKIAAILTTAVCLARGQTEEGVHPLTFRWTLLFALPICALIFPENFSTALLLGSVVFCMMLVGRIELRKLFGSFAVVVAIFALALYISTLMPSDNQLFGRLQTWEKRIERFGDDDVPKYEVKTTDENYQEHHAFMAVANGGVFGQFPGNSRERDFLPQAYSDYVYAIIIEESGLVGGILVMVLYISLLVRATVVASRCTKTFPALLILGVAMLLVFQAMINMGVAVGRFPVTGQPLPMISRGGTSLVITSCYFGIMLSISRSAVKEASDEGVDPDQEPPHVRIDSPNPIAEVKNP